MTSGQVLARFLWNCPNAVSFKNTFLQHPEKSHSNYSAEVCFWWPDSPPSSSPPSSPPSSSPSPAAAFWDLLCPFYLCSLWLYVSLVCVFSCMLKSVFQAPDLVDVTDTRPFCLGRHRHPTSVFLGNSTECQCCSCLREPQWVPPWPIPRS